MNTATATDINIIRVDFTATRDATDRPEREHTTAEVVALPKREPGSDPGSDPVLDRLRRAMDLLGGRLDEQRREVKKFRASTLRLKGAIDEMKHSFKDFDASLSRIDIMPVRRKALRLANIMESAERTASSARRL